MRKKFTSLIFSALFLLGSSSVWGQQGQGALLPEYQYKITPRRGDISNPTPNVSIIDTIHGPRDVNVVFGAGESSSINGLRVNWPATQTSNTLGGTLYPGNLLIGSEYSKNAVVSIYDHDGQISGALTNVKMYHKNAGGANDPTYTGVTVNSNTYHIASQDIKYDPNKDPGSLAGIGTPGAANPYKYPGSFDGNHYGMLFYPYRDGDSCYVGVWNHVSGQLLAFSFGFDEAKTPYTSTKHLPNQDDGSSLLVTRTGTLNPAGFQSVINTTNYVRPTTVLVSGVSTLESIVIGNVEWYAAAFNGSYIGRDYVGPFYAVGVGGCGHYNGWMYYERDKNEFVWNHSIPSNKYVDAAVRLLDNTDVCVRGNVKDNTSNRFSLGSAGDNLTDALLVLPGANGGTGRSNFRLKIGGNADMLHTQDIGAYTVSNPLMDNFLYSDAGVGPGSVFPRAQSPIWLSGGGDNLYSDEVSGLDWSGYGYLANNTGTDKTKWVPYASTNSSVYGVGGLYNGNTDIHTRSVDGNDTTSIILMGSITNNQNRFNIYSGGMLKNFRSTCINTCDSLVIGRNNQAPVFHLTDHIMPLYIINDGNGTLSGCCDAGIRFHTPAVNNLNAAFASATGGGDLHIQSKSYVNIYDNINFVTSHDNNVIILSDMGYAQTKSFTYTGGTGNLNLWTKGLPSDLSGCGGYILVDGAINVTNSGTKSNGPVLYGTVPGANTINSCIPLGNQNAYSGAALSSLIQTRIQSDNDSVSIRGLYNYTNSDDGALLVQGDRKVNFQQGATINLTGGSSDVAIQSKNANVKFGNILTYTGDNTTDLFIDGETGITYTGGSITQPSTVTNVNVGFQSNNGTILFKDAPFHFDVTNTDYLQIWAGKNIDIRNTLTYEDHVGTPTHVHLFANDSILTNAHWGGAPVTFTVGNTTANGTLTDWIAGGNIHTSDLVTFNYHNTNNSVGNLTLKSLGGNIVMDRPVNVAYDSENSILLSAELDCAERNTPNEGYNSSGTGGNRNIFNGNILFNDSLNIIRTNQNPGNTDIIGRFNVRTAMVTMEDASSFGNNTTINSRQGDIFLGYSTVPDGKTTPAQSNISFDLNRFKYRANANNATGKLIISAGFDDQANVNRDGGGNIYFTHIDATMDQGGNHSAEIVIPFSNEYYCGSTWIQGMLHERLLNGTMGNYEHAGIIGGLGRCGIDAKWSEYAPMQGPNGSASDTSLIYRANNGNLLVDAGLRGNIIMNRGSYLDFQDDAANAFFLTRSGDIDLRGQTNIDNLQGSVLFLASSEDPNKLNTGICGCGEQQNNVYLQDLEQRLLGTSKGSIYIGADNNIKLQYGGLKDIGTQKDPFLSENAGYDGIGCGSNYHCDSDTSENRARRLNLDFSIQNGHGGMGIVASDLVDIYRDMNYRGGNGPGMGAVPTYGTLHGETVAGYGLYIKSQANKDNWNQSHFDIAGKCGRTCVIEDCDNGYLHNTARVTFHADARFYAENQRVYIGSPVLETYGNLELNTSQNPGSKTSIMLHTDSLICHDSLIIDGNRTRFNTWSNLNRGMPIIKLGHHRFTPPFTEDGTVCAPCFVHEKTDGRRDSRTALDSIYVTFRNGASVERLHTLVADHAAISFLTDSFDNVKGNPVLNAKFYTDTFKVRNHVELFCSTDHTHDGHFELISEAQMGSKDYAGIYARHMHMEPVNPACTNISYSQLWMQDPALDVITTSTFGGFGTIHADVHVEIEAKLAPGYASLGKDGNCYEQKAGTLRMQDLRLDKGAEIHYSIGNEAGFDGELADCIEVDELTIYGSVDVFVEKRICQNYEPGCYPIIRYKSVAIDEVNLNNLKLGTKAIDGTPLSLDTSTPGVVYLCVGENARPPIRREIHIPETSGVTMISPEVGDHYINSYGNFTFKVKFDSEPPLKVTTGRIINGKEEELVGIRNAKGEYVYVIRQVKENIVLKFGPEYATANDGIDGRSVWSHGTTIYIRVDQSDIASIYSIAGQLVKRIELAEGSTSVTMERGVYIVTLKDGSVHKLVLK